MKEMHLENPCKGGQNYVSPSSKVVEFQPEGVLCGSGNGTFGINDWERDSDSLNW